MADRETLDDPALVAAVRSGSEAALAEVYRRHGGAVWAVARQVCRRPELAEEVCQVVLADLWSRPDRYDRERGSLRSWLVSQARGRAIDAVRAEEARHRREVHHARLNPRQADDDVAASAFDTAELTARVRGALTQIPQAQREAILLTYFAGHTHQEAAGLLGTPAGTIKSRIRLGLGALRDSLAAEEATP
jgi:RNA polymerase sigma-70 factor (ECF subfamily)